MQHLRKYCTRANEKIKVEILFAPHLFTQAPSLAHEVFQNMG
jgi:hypothetical protein